MRFLLILFLFYNLLSCNKDTPNKNILSSNKKNEIKIIEDNYIIKTKIINLHNEAKKIIDSWQEYNAVAEYVPKFLNSTTRDALFNANQFYKLSNYLKDSIRVKQFKKPSFKTRLNVLNSEALRLFDMDSIPSITNKEVIDQTKKIINAFNAINIKINNIVKREIITKDLVTFNHLFEKKDTLALKPISIKQEKRNIKKRKQFLKHKRIQPLKAKKTVK